MKVIDLPEYAEPGTDDSLIADVLKAPFKGIANAGISVWDLADTVTGDILPDAPDRFESATFAGSMVQGVSNFLTGFIPVFGQLGKVGLLAKGTGVLRGAVAGAITDFAVFDAQEGNLSTLIQSHPKLANPITELLATSEEDSEVAGRLKNVAEGLGLGTLSEGLVKGVRGIRRARRAKAEGNHQQVVEEMANAFGSPDEIRSVLQVDSKLTERHVKITEDMRARLPEMVKGSKANLDAIEGPEEIAPLLEHTANLMAQKGEKVTIEGLRTEGTEELIKEITGMEWDAVVEYSYGILRDGEKVARKMNGYKTLLEEAANNLHLKAKQALNGGYLEEVAFAKAEEIMNNLGDFYVAFGRIPSRSLNARRGGNYSSLTSREAATNFLDGLGSPAYRKAHIEKYAAMDPIQAGKAARQNTSLTGRLLRAHNEGWMNSILSGPQTFMVNMMSNAFTTGFLPAERALGGLLNGDMGVIRSSMTQYVFMLNSVRESTHMAFKALKTDAPVLRGPYGGGMSRSDTIKQRAISSRDLKIDPDSMLGALTDKLGSIVNLPTRFLMSTDEFFQQINYRSAAQMKLYRGHLDKGLSHKEAAEASTKEFQKLLTRSGELYSEAAVERAAHQDAAEKGLSGLKKQRHIEKYMERNWDPSNSLLREYADIAEYAKDQAAEATFTRELVPGTIGHSIQKFVQRHPMTQLAVPFVRTPVNLLKFVGQRTFPLVSFKGHNTPVLSKIHKRAMADLASGDPIRMAEAKGRMATGSAIMLTAATMVHEGMITGGGPPSEQERELLMETGWRPYSFKFGDTYVSYQRFDPFSTLFGVIADYSYVANRQDDATQGVLQTLQSSIIVSLTQNITNKSYLAGIAKVVDVLNQPERFGAATARQHVASYVPNLLGQAVVGLGQDEAMREVRTLSDALLGRIPGATHSLEPRRNLLGKIVERQLHTIPFMHNLSDWVNPAVISHDKKDKVFEELANLQHGFTQPPPVLQKRINMLDYTNEKGQSSYDRWMELMGEIELNGMDLHTALDREISSKSYKRLASKGDILSAGVDGVDSPRITKLNSILRRYRKVALRKTYTEFPELNAEVQKTLQLNRATRSGENSEQLQALINN